MAKGIVRKKAEIGGKNAIINGIHAGRSATTIFIL